MVKARFHRTALLVNHVVSVYLLALHLSPQLTRLKGSKLTGTKYRKALKIQLVQRGYQILIVMLRLNTLR